MKVIPFSPPDISDVEISNIVETLKSGWITTGPKCKEFERKICEYIGTDHSCVLNSATAGLELTLKILGVGPGDEVITTAYTYTSTAAVINHVGAKIVFLDTQKDSYEIDYDSIESAITEKTKVIIPVDIGGKLCNYEKIFKAVQNKKDLFRPNSELQEAIGRLTVLADSAHGFGSIRNNKLSGKHADFTVFSFHAVKNLTTCEGGAVTWNPIEGICDEYIYKKYMLLALHGQSKDAFSKSQIGSWEYDIMCTGYKCNMTDTLASIGLGQLSRYNKMIQQRRDIVKKYSHMAEELGIHYMHHFGDDFTTNCHLFLTRIPNISEEQRNEIIIQMGKKGITCNVHFKPLPMMTAYKKLGFDIKNYPNAYNHYKNEITLPLHTLLSDEDVAYVITSYKEIINNLN